MFLIPKPNEHRCGAEGCLCAPRPKLKPLEHRPGIVGINLPPALVS